MYNPYFIGELVASIVLMFLVVWSTKYFDRNLKPKTQAIVELIVLTLFAFIRFIFSIDLFYPLLIAYIFAASYSLLSLFAKHIRK